VFAIQFKSYFIKGRWSVFKFCIIGKTNPFSGNAELTLVEDAVIVFVMVNSNGVRAFG